MQKLSSIFHHGRKLCGLIIFTFIFLSNVAFAAASSESSNIAIKVGPADPASSDSHLTAKPIVITNLENRPITIVGLLVTGYDKTIVKYCASGDTSCAYASTCLKWPNPTVLASNGGSCNIYLQAKTTNQISSGKTTPVYITFYAGKIGANPIIIKKFNVAYENTLYVGGRFNAAGDPKNKTNNIAKWDGTNWSTLAGGLNRDVMALVMYHGDLYAGGFFDYGIASWNGANWSVLGGGLINGGARALAVDGNNLYVGGAFTHVNINGKPTLVNNIAMWNGSCWSSLANGTNYANGQVHALAMKGNNLYVGGYFETASDKTVNNIALWNGSSWSNLGHGTDGDVNALLVKDDALYVGGSFNYANGAIARGMAKWDDRAGWTYVSGINSSNISAFAANADDLYVGGDSFIASGWTRQECIGIWDSISKNWQHMGIGTDSSVKAFAVSGKDLYVAGAFPSINSGAIPASKIAKWDMSSSTWTTLGNGIFGDIAFTMAVVPSIKITE